MDTPLLLKEAVRTIVQQGQPPRGPVASVPFQLFGCPLPLGYCYNQFQVGGSGPVLPNSPESYAGWMQYRLAPTEYTTEVAGVQFRTLEQLLEQYPGGVVPMSGWTPVYQEISGVLTLVGYNVPIMVPGTAHLPPAWHGAISYMTLIQFDGTPLASNGYPLHDGPYIGHFDVPTPTGVTRVTETYVKDSLGVLLPSPAAPLPDHCVRSGAAKVVMFAGFPGRDAAAEVPAEISIDDQAGWNAGANSIDERDTDVRTEFQIALRSALAVGLASPMRGSDTTPESLDHAFYFDLAGTGRYMARIMERGRIKMIVGVHDPESVYAIERVGHQVTYFVDDEPVYLSRNPSTGSVRVGTALYRAGDGVY